METRFAVILLLLASPVSAQIYRWDNGQLLPGTEGIQLGPGVQFSGLDLHFGDFRNADLTGAVIGGNRFPYADFTGAKLIGINFGSDLTAANFTNADLTNASFEYFGATGGLEGVNWTGATIRGMKLRVVQSSHFSKENLYSTASYQQKDLRGINLSSHSDMSGWDFSGQDLTGADLSDASNLGNANFAGANLTEANLLSSSVYGANFADATIARAILPGNISAEQIYSTASYQAKDLQGIQLRSFLFELPGIDFSGQDLRGAFFMFAPCSRDAPNRGFPNANFSGANLTGVSFEHVCITGANFEGAIGFVDPRIPPPSPGDSNRDGLFNTSDLVQVFQAGEYEDDIQDNSSWEDGDWNGDMDFNTNDLVAAFQTGKYEVAGTAVPEPSGMLIILIAATCLGRYRRTL